MKSYLSLIPISARAHRRQNRMTRLCIIFAVFMVTAIFSMAEMGTRMEQTRLAQKHGGFSLWDLFGSAMGQTLLLVAAVLFLLVLAAGVLMISGSLHSSVAQRTQFFGMMRCIGMSRQQIARFVRLEALNWCKTAIPAGLVLGIAVSWILCAVLRFWVGEEFSSIPLFGISGIGIISGVLVGIVTVLLAAQAPARRAASVSPAAAVSASMESRSGTYHTYRTAILPIEITLGIQQAAASKKNLALITGSFALSIVLFLSFSVLIDFVDHLMPQSAAAADLELSSPDGGNSIDSALTETLESMDGVERVYGRRSSFALPARWEDGSNSLSAVDLVSFDAFDLNALKKDGALRRGSDLARAYGDSSSALAAWDPTCSWENGDTVMLGTERLEIAGLLKYDPFRSDGLTGGQLTLIVSDETFVRLTGITDYALLMIQTSADVPDETVEAIRQLAEENGWAMTDRREQSTRGTYLAFTACVYGFLGIIALVAVLNIVNCISMSVTARIRQYGAMRAVGMDEQQITRMIAAQAFTYALTGCVSGCAVGLPLSRLLYGFLILKHFPYAVWQFPFGRLVVVFVFVLFAAAAAVWAPARRIQRMSVTETVNEL